MEIVLLAALGWIVTIVVQLFIIYQFYVLLKRFVIAAERQAGALERFEPGFAKHEDRY